MNQFKFTTEIDTLSIQTDCKDIEEQQYVRYLIKRAIGEFNKVWIEFNNILQEDEIFFNRNKIGGIRLGMTPIGYDQLNKKHIMKYYVSVSFAGLKTYYHMLDNLSQNCLFSCCGILNLFNYDYKFTELDLCIDMHTDIKNILVFCVSKLPRTGYHPIDNSFYNGNSVYIEKLDEHELNYASQRSYVYNKAKKENLPFPMTRFEQKLLKPFFSNNFELDYETIDNALNRYMVLYFDNPFEKELVINKYNSYSRIGKRDIARMNLDKYILTPNAEKVVSFLEYLKSYRLC